MLRQLLEEQKNLGGGARKETVFRIYKSASEIGTQIKEDLLSENSNKFITETKENKGAYTFCIDDSTGGGLLDRAYGVFLLTNLFNGFEANFTRPEKTKLKNSFINLLNYVKEDGFSASPYISDAQNKEIFSDKGLSFIESVTWCISCFLYAHRLQKRDKGDFDFGKDKQDIDVIVANAISVLCDNVIRKVGSKYELGAKEGSDNYIGWGSVTGSTQPSLYFTQSVCETFGDLEDTILGNEELGISKDEEYIDRLNGIAGYDVVGRFTSICRSVGKNVYNEYEKNIGQDFFYEDGSVATKSQIESSGQSTALLNQLYAVMVPIYTNYHKVLEKNDPEKFKVFQIKVKDGVDMVYKEYTELLAKGKEGIVNRDTVSFYGALEDKKAAGVLTKTRINVAVLEALIVRARAMIVTYVTKYPEKELGEIIGIIENSRPDPELWVWDDLQQTERAVSALKEFFDYYQEYELAYAKMTAEAETLSKRHDRELEDLKKHMEEDHLLNIKHERSKYEKRIGELNERINQLTGDLAVGSPIESEIKRCIDDVLAQRLDGLIVERLARVAESNRTGAPLTDSEKAFKKALDSYVLSYVSEGIAAAKTKDGMPAGFRTLSEEQLLGFAKSGLNTLVSEFVAFCALRGAEDDIEMMFEYLRNKSGAINTVANVNNKIKR